MFGARPWLRSESKRSFSAGWLVTITPPSPVAICLFA